MGKYGSASFAVLLADGYNLLAAKVQNVSHKVSGVLQKSDGLGDGWDGYTPTGSKRATLTQDGGFFDDTANATHDAFKGSTNVSRFVVAAPFGNIIGASFLGAQGAYGQTYEVLGAQQGLTRANVTYTVNGQADRGQIVQPLGAKVANWNTKTDGGGASADYTAYPQTAIPITSSSVANPSVITTPVPHGLTTGQVALIAGHTGSTPAINGPQIVTVTGANTFTIPVNVTIGGTGGAFVLGSTVAGGAGYLEVSAYSGFTNVVIKIRSSVDDSVYADLVTFTTVVGGPGDATAAQRVTVAGTVARYLCVTGTVTGSGSITPFVGFARF